VAKILGHADTSTLSRWERGIVLPGILQAFQLAQIYDVLPHDLFNQLWNDLSKDKSLLTQYDESFNSNMQLFL
jgi:transcriptional regulator with XRE-family HTH domain